MSALLAIVGVFLDRRLGEPRCWHPLVGFGYLATRVERQLNRPGAGRIQGVLATLVLLLPAIWLAILLQAWLGWPFSLLCLVLALGGNSLAEHARAVARPLADGDLMLARTRLGMMVSRETVGLSPPAIARGCVESVLENGLDSQFGALFWFVLAGAPGVVFYRLANTLDAMWGYRSERFAHFGWAVAKLDDGLNWLPARLTAASYLLCGNWRRAARAWREQASLLASPNAGPVMCAGGGALGVKLGGDAVYQGRRISKPWFGGDNDAGPADIHAALKLFNCATGTWCVLLLLGGLLAVAWG